MGVIAARRQVTATLSPVGAKVWALFRIARLLHFAYWGLEGIGP